MESCKGDPQFLQGIGRSTSGRIAAHNATAFA
jgi:hypothetical protein